MQGGTEQSFKIISTSVKRFTDKLDYMMINYSSKAVPASNFVQVQTQTKPDGAQV